MIYIAADHAGFELKSELIAHFRQKGYEVGDLGPYKYDETDDYPDFIYPCAQRVAGGKPSDLGVVIGGSGQGEAIVANKVKGIRAAVYNGEDMELVRVAKSHNNANVLAIGARFVSAEQAKEAIDTWLNTKFEGGRHIRRLEKIKRLEEKHVT